MKAKDNIEEIILKNLEGLNDSEPLEGHFERFEARLKMQHKKKRIFSLNVVWKVAAAVIFVLAITGFLIYVQKKKKRKKKKKK